LGKLVVMPNQFGRAPQTVGKYPTPPTTGRRASDTVSPTAASLDGSKMIMASTDSSSMNPCAAEVAVGASPRLSSITSSTGRSATPPLALVWFIHASRTSGTPVFVALWGPLWSISTPTRTGVPGGISSLGGGPPLPPLPSDPASVSSSPHALATSASASNPATTTFPRLARRGYRPASTDPLLLCRRARPAGNPPEQYIHLGML
jgi:hypothetical protein